jgi:hydrogenase maturation factor HypE
VGERDSRSSRRSSRRGDEDRDRKRSRREEDIEEETERLKAERLRKEKEAKLKELESKLAAKLEEEKKMKELSKITTYQGQGTQMGGTNTGNRGQMIEITLNDRLGKKVRVKAWYVAIAIQTISHLTMIIHY